MDAHKLWMLRDFIGTNKVLFRIPVYQRNYDWSESNCNRLLEDIYGIMQSGDKHFLGTIVFMAAKSGGFALQEYIIIDGQQRLTTLMLILKALSVVAESVGDDCYHEIEEQYLHNKYCDEEFKVKLKPIKSDNNQFTLLLEGKIDEMDEDVPARVYRIITEATVHGGTIAEGETVTDVNRAGEVIDTYTAQNRIDYAPNQLDRSVINPNQIEAVLKSYMDAIYTDLYPEREEKWQYIPKTLIFAKDDNHATKIVEAAKKVFAVKFANGEVPENFVQKITYSAGDSNALIRDLRTEKDFRIAVTVTLVATGTDVKPLEVVLFMNDVKSDVLYTQMKGRGCRTLGEDKLREVTPNADNKSCFYIVDAVGVTESDKTIPQPGKGSEGGNPKPLRLDQLLEHLSHGEVSDDNLALLRDYCATIQKRYEFHPLFERHLNMFISDYSFSPRELANNINQALAQNTLPPYTDISDDNTARKNLIFCLMGNLQARKKLLELQRGYYAVTPEKEDKVIYKGFSKETAKSFITNFEQYLNDNADKIEALRIIYNSEDTVITYSMLTELQDKLIAENGQFTPYYIWKNYKILDVEGNVEDLDIKQNIKALTHLIQLVRYAYHKNDQLVSLIKGYSQRFSLYCGQAQRELTVEQRDIMKQIADYIVEEGSISTNELNSFDTDLWRRAMKSFGAPGLVQEIITLSKFILKAA